MNEKTSESGERKSLSALRVWPVVLLLIAMAVMKMLPSFFEDESMVVLFASIMGPLLLGVLILVWWVAFSRASGKERIIGLVGVIVSLIVVCFVMDPTMMGPGLILIGVPLGMAAFGIVATLLSRVLSFKRTVAAILAAAIGFGFVTLLRNDGMWGHGQLGLNWRWEKSPEETLLAERKLDLPAHGYSESDMDDWLSDPQWPQFRGPKADSRQSGSVIASDWSTVKPEVVWKTKVGPGWSSFSVAGNLLFTQEQLGENETVVCYSADKGKEIWRHQIKVRFFDPLGGPGPRATPTLSNGMLFTQSAMGEVQRLDPKTGELIWSKDVKEVADCDPPMWGFSSSPLVVGSNVIAFAGGDDDKGVVAFDVETGATVWSAKTGKQSYSTPQLATFDGRDCVLMMSDFGLNILDPQTGTQLLEYEWTFSGYRATQPQVIDGNSILVPTQELGTRRIKIESNAESGSFTATEEWTSPHMKPDFNDFVIYENNAYGFTGTIFTSISLETGKRNWKGGRYGKGQVLLLQDAGLLLVVSESGEVVLLKADPESRQELAKFQALEGRTWNHPVVIGDRLFVRNSQEAVCYKLPMLDAVSIESED